MRFYFYFCALFCFLALPLQASGLPSPAALLAAKRGYRHAVKLNLTSSPWMFVIDYTKPSTERRFWILNIPEHFVKVTSYVAHGTDTGLNYATKFSDTPNSHQSSLGFFLTDESYSGKHGQSLRLIGLEKYFNAHAKKRGIVIHAANYISEKFIKHWHRLGRSWGCFAVNDDFLEEVLKSAHQPILLLSYYPEKSWLEQSKFLSS